MSKEELAKNDSIKKYLKLAGNDTLDFKLRDKFNNRAFSLVDLSKNDTLTRFYLSLISANYIKTIKLEKYKDVAVFHFEKSKSARDTFNLAQYYRYNACYFREKKIYDSAFYCYLKAEKLYKDIGDNASSAYMQLNKGIVQFTVGDYSGSELSLLKAYSTFKKSNDIENLYQTLNQLGLVYNELFEYEKSLIYHKKSLDYVTNYNLKDIKYKDAVCYNNIGYLYLNQENYNEAIINFELALKSEVIINYDIELYALLKSNLGYSKFKIKDYKGSLINLLEALEFKEQLKGKPVLINIYVYLSEYYNEVNDYKLSSKYSKIALNEAEKTKRDTDLIVALKQAIILDESKSKYYLEKYTKILNNCFSDKRNSKERFDKIQFLTSEITEEKKTAIKEKWIIGVLSSIVILFIGLLLIITWQRSKQKELKLQQSQQKANEDIYDLMLAQKDKEELARESEKKRIAIELHDGVMNKLASIRLNLNVLSNKNDKETIDKCLTHINEIHSIENEIRDISHNLNQEVFGSNNSFENLIHDFVNMQNETSKTNFSYEIQVGINWEEITSEIKMNLYRIIQESSYNINKFSKAKEAVISILLDGKNICLSISDNGKGFNVEIQTDGIGLKNIRQRVKSLNGRFLIQSVEGKSTSLNISIPLGRP